MKREHRPRPENAIVGLAYNYNIDVLSPFLNSLEKTRFDGDLVLFVNSKTSNIPPTQSFNVTTIDFERTYFGALLLHRAIRKITPSWAFRLSRLFNHRALKSVERSESIPPYVLAKIYLDNHISISRYLLYYNLIFASPYNQVFLTDVRDVLFQSNIFDGFGAKSVYAFAENLMIKLGDQSSNKEWILHGYGQDVLDRIYSENIYCSGTILGDRHNLLTFLGDFAREVLGKSIPRKMVGLDQGIFNFLVSYKQCRYFSKDTTSRLVYTLGTNPASDFAIRKGKIVSCSSQFIPAVVHQYDRHPSLVDFARDNFCKTLA